MKDDSLRSQKNWHNTRNKVLLECLCFYQRSGIQAYEKPVQRCVNTVAMCICRGIGGLICTMTGSVSAPFCSYQA